MERLLWSKIFCYPKPPKWYTDGDVKFDLNKFKLENPFEYEYLRMESMPKDEKILLCCQYEIPSSSSVDDFWCRFAINSIKKNIQEI